MADLPPPGIPNQGEADDASNPDTHYDSTESGDDSSGTDSDEENTEVEDDDDHIPLREILESQKAGEFDFDRDSIIGDLEDFRRRRHEYDTMHDKPRAGTTIPTDAPTMRRYVRRLIEAVLRRYRATNNTNKSSRGMNHLNKLKPIEIEMKFWGAMLVACDVHRRRPHSRSVWGIERPRFEDYNSLEERVEEMSATLETSEDAASALVREGLSYLQRLAAAPKAMLKKHASSKKSNVRKATIKAELVRRVAEFEGEDPSLPLNATQPLVRAFGPVPTEKAAGEAGFAAPKDAPSSAASTQSLHSGGREQYGAQSGYIGSAARQGIAKFCGHKPQPKTSAVDPFIPESVREEFLPPVPYPVPPPMNYSGTSNSAKKRPCPSAQPPEGAVKKQKRHSTRDDTHLLKRNEAEGSLGTSKGNKRSTAFPSNDLTKTSSQSARTGSTGRKPFPGYPGHEPQRETPMDHESIAKPADNEMSIQPVLRLWPPNSSQRPGQTSRAPPTNSLSAAARLPSATAQPRLRSPNGLSLSRDVQSGDDPIAPFGSRYPAKKKKKKKKGQNPPSQLRDGASPPGARGPDATARFRKIRKQDGNDYYCEQNDYEGEADEE